MDSHMKDEQDSEYLQAVDDERTAWHELQAQPAGSAQRADAWARWSDAISRTNAAWRRLSGARRSSQSLNPHAQPHRPAC
jgi:ferric-dicitrate binding protein FerR (iron transport regulator)